MTWLERKVLALIEYVRANPRFQPFEAEAIANDALEMIGALSKRHKDTLLNVCGDLLSIFPTIKRHLNGDFRDLFDRYEGELLSLQIQAERLKREGKFS